MGVPRLPYNVPPKASWQDEPWNKCGFMSVCVSANCIRFPYVMISAKVYFYPFKDKTILLFFLLLLGAWGAFPISFL